MSDTAPKQINLDIQKCHFDKNGVTDFWWPFSAEELRSFSNDAMHIYAQTISSFDNNDPLILHPYRLIAKSFICELAGLFQADALFARAKRENISLTIPEGARFWQAVKKGSAPDPDDILNKLRNGPHKLSLYHKIFNFRRLIKIFSRFQKNKSGLIGFSIDGLKISPITQEILKNKIIATERYSLIAQHARQSNIDVYFQRSDRWFGKIHQYEEKKFIKKSYVEFENNLIEKISDLYKKYGEELPETSRDYYVRFLNHGAAIMAAHFYKLIQNPQNLPQNLWTGTGGHTWDAILRLAVRYNSGKTCGHDHATGSGHFKMLSVSFVELWGYDEYFTFNAAKHAGFIDTIKDSPFLEKDIPQICFPRQEKNIKPIKQFNSSDTKTNRIVLMSGPYDRDWGRIDPNMPDIVRLDWQCRLLDYLQLSGYNILFKLHPESIDHPPKNLYSSNNITISKLPFEDVIQEGDIVIFDYIFTSTFRTVLETNLPMIIIESVDYHLTSEAKDLLEKRAEFIKITYDDKNKATINSELLLSSIEKAKIKSNNHQFAELFLAE
ncbi:MAG TPA: hypothetical protein PK690_10235 [Emcibacteraceae bacterium]|nr:hypothetical protein [Emcibacteraceae bacterium]